MAPLNIPDRWATAEIRGIPEAFWPTEGEELIRSIAEIISEGAQRGYSINQTTDKKGISMLPLYEAERRELVMQLAAMDMSYRVNIGVPSPENCRSFIEATRRLIRGRLKAIPSGSKLQVTFKNAGGKDKDVEQHIDI